MANTVKLKKSSVAAKVPTTSDLTYGEVAINYTDGKLYFRDSSDNIKSFKTGTTLTDYGISLVSGTDIKTVNSSSIIGSGNLSVGTVTSVNALTIGTTGTDVTSSVASGTTTPTITINIPTASATNRGALSSTDWSTFNGKQAGNANLTSLAALSTSTTGLVKLTNGTASLDTNSYATTNSVPVFSGGVGGTEGGEIHLAKAPSSTSVTSDTVIDIYDSRIRIYEEGGNHRGAYIDLSACANSVGTNLLTGGTGGSVTSVAALTIGTTGTDITSTVANSTTTPVITLNVPTASATNRGALSSTDWSTFNGKQAALVSQTNIKSVNGNSLLGSGDLTISGLPTQTGNNGKFLTTDGTSASWGSLPHTLSILNRAASTINIAITTGYLTVLNRSNTTINVSLT